jgi:2-amino-4-hydroxy-6-hydroxymethyldihydropteridine diphosphokinase
MPHTEFGFSLGSNLGDRLVNLSEARRRLVAVPGTTLVASSPVYETEPVGVRNEYTELRFLNAVLIATSDKDPRAWLEEIARIEKDLGRQRTEDRNAPRPIDIDILYAGESLIDDGGLEVPHPRWMQRRFVVRPLADVRPDLVLPGAGATVKEILAALPEEGGVEKAAERW